MTGGWRLEWADCRSGTPVRRAVEGVDTLEAVLDEIELCALLDDAVLQVDLWASPPTDDPLLVQFLVGERRHGCLLWHRDGETLVAVEPSVPLPRHDITYSRVGGTHRLDACCARLRPETVRQALVAYILTHERPLALSWQIVEAD